MMKRYIAVLAASLALAGCAHNETERGGTYNQSDTYRGGMEGQTDWDANSNYPSGAQRTPGANEHSPPPLAPGAYAQPGFGR